MTRIIQTLAVLAIFAGPASAQDLTIDDVITQQLQAFRDRDVQEAWQFASPSIKDLFDTPDTFGAMVQNGYPMVWDNSDVRFLDQDDLGAFVRQEVQIQGPDGLFYILDYQMIETPEGWQIDAVQVIPSPEVMS